jgi:arabinose-5-phosphate isomerase
VEQQIDKMLLKCVVIRSDQSVKDLLRMLSADGSNFVAVVDAEGKAVGVATENDLLKLLKLEPIAGVQAVVTSDVGREIFDQPVTSIMTKEPVRLRNTATAKEALETMVSSGLRYMLVVDYDGKPAGYVRLMQVLKRMASGQV